MTAQVEESTRETMTTPRILGSMVWFSISGTPDGRDENGRRRVIPLEVSTDDLTKWFEELELDPLYLPQRISMANAFKSASSKISAEYELADAPGSKVQLAVVDFTQDPEQIVRHIVRTVIDSRQKKTARDKVGELRFNRGRRGQAGRIPGTQSVRSVIRHGLPEQDHEQVAAQIAAFEERYRRLSTYRDEDDMRTVLRAYLRGSGAIAVEPSKGIYFLTPEQNALSEALAEFTRRLGAGCSYRQLPVLDDWTQRGMLAEAFEEQIEDEIRLLEKEIDRFITADRDKSHAAAAAMATKYGNFQTRFNALLARRDEMFERLSHSGSAQLDEALMTLREKIIGVSTATRIPRR